MCWRSSGRSCPPAFSLTHLAVCAYRPTCIDSRTGPLAKLLDPVLSASPRCRLEMGGREEKGRLGHLYPGCTPSGALCCLCRVQQSQNPYQADLSTRPGSGYSSFPGLLRPQSDMREVTRPMVLLCDCPKAYLPFIHKLFVKFFPITQFENAKCFLPESD